MPLTVVPEPPADDGYPASAPASSLIDQIVREGARKMLAAALHAEVDAYIAHGVLDYEVADYVCEPGCPEEA